MMNALLHKDIKWSTVIAPPFYFVICLGLLRLCLFSKAIFFLLRELFTCCGDSTSRKWKVFVVDFFFSSNELFFFIVLLFTLLYNGAVESTDQTFTQDQINSRLLLTCSCLHQMQDHLAAVHYLLWDQIPCSIPQP